MFSSLSAPRFGANERLHTPGPSRAEQSDQRTPPPLLRQAATQDLFTPSTSGLQAPPNSVEAPRPRRQRTLAVDLPLSELARVLFPGTSSSENAMESSAPPELDANGDEMPSAEEPTRLIDWDGPIR